MPLTKVCPQCSAVVNCRKSVCVCGYAFNTKTLKSPRERKTAMRVFQAEKRTAATPTETLARQERDRDYKAAKKASETPGEMLARQKRDRACKAAQKASESPAETFARLERNRACKATRKACESSAETIARQKSNRACKTVKRLSPMSIEEAISNFLSLTKLGPEFVCTCCHRMMYKQSVVRCNHSKYTKTSSTVLDQVFCDELNYISNDGIQWVCYTCDRALSRGNMPLQAKANGLQLCSIPAELSCLNPLELRLVSLRVPFMKMVALPTGKQRSIHGPAVNVPSKVDTLCTVLPRLPSQSELIPLKLKRKLAYKGHYMYDYITPEKVLCALTWLKKNNPLYADIEINQEWLEQGMTDDNELFSSLLEPTDTSEPMQCDTTSSTDSTQCEAVTPSTSCDPVAYVDKAFTTLTSLAKYHGFTIHDVPLDGNCMFSSLAYQLQCAGMCDTQCDSTELRDMVANYLQNHSSTYSHFVSQPVYSDNAYDADTGPPSVVDEFISSITDPELRSELTCEQYITRLRNGAWGDHITIQVIADIFGVTINVLSTSSGSIIPVVPRDSIAHCELYIGLMMQYHYVALDRIADQTPPATNTSTIDRSVIDDSVFDEGDQHAREITIGPQASMMTVENPESIVSVAPAEGQKPLSIMTDTSFEAMCNPDKFCYSDGIFSNDRPRKLTYRKYFNQRLLDVDGRFARDLDYLFVAQYIVEANQVSSDTNNFIWRQKPSRQFTAAQAKDDTFINQFVRANKAYSFMKNIRGSPPYYQRTFYDLLAMIRQLGTPTWFFTLSAADMKWPDMIQTIAKQYGVYYTDEDVNALSFEDKSNWLRRNPVTAARHFHYRLNVFFQQFLKSTAKPLGNIADYAIRIEFQARGSPHAHCVIWVKDAPKYGIDDNQLVCDFIDQYITCAIPSEEGKLKELVLLLQQHKHSSYCKRHNKCRFTFPKPPSTKTLITHCDVEPDVTSNAQSVLSKVYPILADNHADLSLEEILDKAEVTMSDYMNALEVSSKGNVVLLKRNPSECNINNYNSSVMLAWQANMDLQFVLNAYACVMYVASYMMKTEKAMGVLLKQVAAEFRTEELKTQLRKVGSAFLTHREVSAQEAAYRILSIPMKQLSRSVVYVDTNPKHERIAVLKDKTALGKLDDDDTNVFQKRLIDRYQHRPDELSSMSLAEFAATYVTNYQCKDDTDDGDVLPACDTDSDTSSTQIQLTDGFGRMNKRKHEAVIRFHRYNKDAEPSNWYRAKLMLYYPWYDEHSDLQGGYETYEQHYTHVKSIVLANESKYTHTSIEDIEVDEDGPPEHLWSIIAPSTEASRSQSLAEGSEPLTEVSNEDLRDNANILSSGTTANLHVRFDSATNQQVIPADQYRQMLRELNDKQRSIVMFHRNWCKKAVIALKHGKPVEPYRVFLSGPGGVGKSHVIKLIHSDTVKFFKLSGTVQPDDVIVLLTAPTGVAAFNIGGMTLHSALLLGRSKYTGFQPLNRDKLNSLRTKLSHLMLVIIDEVSMVGSNMLLEIHKRLQQIKGVTDDVTFGGVSILAVGDLYQLPPVGQPLLFSSVTDGYAQLYGSGSLWIDEFQLIELDQIMRQRGDSTFSELLCRVRTNTCTSTDIDILKCREITADDPNYPTNALHVYRLNSDVDSRNSLMLNKLASTSQQYVINASDSVAGQTSHISLSNLSDKRSETGGLHGVLKLAIGARVMLTANIDVSDGLVNGARGEVVNIITNTENFVTKILVKFDNAQVGLRTIQSSPYRTAFPNAVPIGKHEVMFFAKQKRGSEITRLQFPLTLAWATTIHKVQGLTLDDIVVNMKGGRFSPGQAYVAFSRVKTLQGLYITNFNAAAIKASTDVQNEITRLNTKLLENVSPLRCESLSSSHVTIALLNVRSIVPKLPDIACDPHLKCASIVCFCETWLTKTQSSPLISATPVCIRCDRASGDNKGGVMICVSRDIQLTQSHSFTCSGIEALCTTLVLPNSSILEVGVLYRSPNASLANLNAILSKVLQQLSSITPCVIVGDFNEDLLRKLDSRLLSYMTSNGYVQLVQSPTTANGTLIDHVYCSNACGDTIVEVQDTYYSDHDTVYCSLPL